MGSGITEYAGFEVIAVPTILVDEPVTLVGRVIRFHLFLWWAAMRKKSPGVRKPILEKFFAIIDRKEPENSGFFFWQPRMRLVDFACKSEDYLYIYIKIC